MSISLFHDLLNTLTLRGTRARRSYPSAASPAQLEVECNRLLTAEAGEPSSIDVSRKIFALYAALQDADRLEFFRCLQENFGPDREKIDSAYAKYKKSRNDAALQSLFNACEPPRQELLRRLNLAPEGTPELVSMREALLRRLKDEPGLRTVDRDFRHLFNSWFNRGFLVLRRIDWNSPASLLEKLIRYEAVHTIRDWQDLRRRLDPCDRRCFAFFHPALGDDPLIFVEVALTDQVPKSINSILHAERGDLSPELADTAAFFSISNCQPGLHGISFGNFLLKQVVLELKRDLPNLKTFVTVSPIPGFSAWLKQLRVGEGVGPELSSERQELLERLDEPDWHEQENDMAFLKKTIMPLTAWYLTQARNKRGLPLNSVARFHLRNGARLEGISWLGDVSDKGLSDGAGLVINYLYDLEDIDSNYEKLINDGVVETTASIRRLASQANDQKQGATS
jgi:malonyl-CoA decarboxylase